MREVRIKHWVAAHPEMHQTKKGNQWHFGMKAHIGVDADSGLVHTVFGTAAHVSDVTQAGALLAWQRNGRFGRHGLSRRRKMRRTQGQRGALARSHATGPASNA